MSDTSDRRRNPRIQLLGRLHGHLVSLDVPVTALEISLGGMSIETPFALDANAVEELRLRLGDGGWVYLRARVVYSHRTETTPDGARYISGLEFVDEAPESPVPDIIDELN